ncbi:ApaG protein [Luteibacter sp. OK325]|uniref:Co2+/Mg2+ efflux protein ApaG n=1 Tax=Luteibacter sp. OK325 TaxID=2135670 RepID=UPI000D3A843F|nr:Co2+/Mg2+ efflux protein ApaG [Luteibacter sp. OK325]PTR34854.1 ApaG protein [Luteibacter sp. OK325]
MNSKTPYTIDVEVESRFVPDQSQPTDNRYVFAYTITLRNAGDTAAQLMTRHWVIKDANGKVEEVRGDGVVGEQPWMRPGESFEYTSGAVLETAVGTMEGTYSMIADDGTQFDAPIPTFVLSIPRTLH